MYLVVFLDMMTLNHTVLATQSSACWASLALRTSTYGLPSSSSFPCHCPLETVWSSALSSQSATHEPMYFSSACWLEQTLSSLRAQSLRPWPSSGSCCRSPWIAASPSSSSHTALSCLSQTAGDGIWTATLPYAFH